MRSLEVAEQRLKQCCCDLLMAVVLARVFQDEAVEAVCQRWGASSFENLVISISDPA